MKSTWKYLTGIALALPLLLAAGGAWAATPANTLIRNSATLTGVGLPAEGITATVDVTVDLKAMPPTLSRATVLTQMPDDNSVTPGQSSTASYRLTTNANGPDTFLITQESYEAINLSGDSGVATYTTVSVPLGATAAAVGASAGASSITVPHDGSDNGNVNGIADTDTVRIGDHDYIVQSVVEDAAGNTATITLSTPLLAAVVAGDPIREYLLFDMQIANVGSVTTGGNPAYIDVSTRATSQADNTLFDADSTTDTASNGSDGHRTNVVSISFGKFVRNITNANGTGPSTTLNGLPFFSTAGDVAAVPGDVMEYALVITTSTAGLTGGAVTDTVPLFTTYQANSTLIDGVTPIADVGGTLPLVGGYSLGDIASAQTMVITFQVKVDE